MECETEVRRPCEVLPVVAETSGTATDYDQERPLVDSPPRPRAQSRRQRRRVLSNPLLDTISAIEDDDSDELGFPDRKGADGETYTAGYVGGSSIDSGYKSSCPTPEMQDIAYYTTTLSPAEQQKRLSVASQTSQDSASSLPGLGAAQKPRIAMGTKVMTRQTASASCVEQPRRRHDSGFSDATLCHLAVVRDNLLRMEHRGREQAAAAAPPRPQTRAPAAPAVRPRSASVGSISAVSPRPLRRSGSPVPPPRAAPRAAAPAPAARPASPPLPPIHPRRRSPSPTRLPARPEPSARRPRPPPTRPAPRESARTAGARPSAGVQRSTREEDIDALMYGRRAAPASTDLLAPSRRVDALGLRGPVAPIAPRLGPAHEAPVHCSGADSTQARPGAGRPAQGIRSKFSHMAQCMLDIIDELHGKGRVVTRPADSPAPSEYHTYEEVMYGVTGRERIAEAAPSPEPPPLPLRPSALFGSARDVSATSTCPPSAPPPPPPVERAPRRPDAPKQRNNLYSLFSSARERRSLSHNLEQEVSGAGPDGDEYGFAVRK